MSPRPQQGQRLAQRRFDRILIVKPSSLGDVVHALPVLAGLRERFPQARIDWLVAPSCAPLIENHPALTETVIFDRRLYGRIGRSWQATKAFIAFMRRLRERSYDLVIDLQGLFRSGFLTFATRAPVRLGFRPAREMASVFYTHHVAIGDADAHAADRNYLVANVLGFQDAPVRFDLALTDAERAEGKALLQKAGAVEGNPIVGVVPGTRWETKRWPPQRFALAIDRLANQTGAHCVLLGSPDERELCARIADLCETAVGNLAGHTKLRQMASVIAGCDVVLCHDSAPMHLAVALGRALVCIVGPTNPSRTGPYRRADDVCRIKVECSPCYLRHLHQCPHDHRCMRELTVEHVVERAATLLQAVRAGAPDRRQNMTSLEIKEISP